MKIKALKKALCALLVFSQVLFGGLVIYAHEEATEDCSVIIPVPTDIGPNRPRY
jgi:hypothetical protein